jgi:hypothetical protein
VLAGADGLTRDNALDGVTIRTPGHEVLLRAGAALPFPRTAAEPAATGAPRRAIAERYASREDYLGRVRAAATELVQARYLLEEDIAPILERAALRWDLFMGASEPGQAPAR